MRPHLVALKRYALLASVPATAPDKDSNESADEERAVLDECDWEVRDVRKGELLSNSNEDLLEYIARYHPSSLALQCSLTPKARQLAARLWAQRSLEGTKSVCVSNNPYLCAACGILYMATGHGFQPADPECALVAAWLRVAALRAERGSLVGFFDSLGSGNSTAMPDLFYDVTVRRAKGKSEQETELPALEAVEQLGQLVRTGAYDPSLSNVLQVACAKCSPACLANWQQGAEHAERAVRDAQYTAHALREGLDRAAFAQVLHDSTSFDRILAALCVGPLRGYDAEGRVAPCIPLVVAHNEFSSLETGPLKWVLAPNLAHSLFFRKTSSDGSAVEVLAAPRAAKHCWLADLWHLSERRTTVPEVLQVFSDRRSTLEFVVRVPSASAAFRMRPLRTTDAKEGELVRDHGAHRSSTWKLDPGFDPTHNYVEREITYEVMRANGIDCVPLLGFVVATPMGDEAPLQARHAEWRRRHITHSLHDADDLARKLEACSSEREKLVANLAQVEATLKGALKTQDDGKEEGTDAPAADDAAPEDTREKKDKGTNQ